MAIRSIGSNHPFLGGQSQKTSQSSKFKHNQTLKQHKHKLKIQKQKTPPNPPETPIKNPEKKKIIPDRPALCVCSRVTARDSVPDLSLTLPGEVNMVAA